MPTLELGRLAQAAGGTLERGDAAAVGRSYAIDTRRIEPGAVFFALRGDRRDGHRFLADACRAGAVAAVVDQLPEGDAAAPPALIKVEDTTRALGRCGESVRRNADGVRWIAVTGSNGKTTTKEMIAAALSPERRVYRTPGNFNNHLGVPLTLLAMPDDTEIAVLELAMSAAGEIAALTAMTAPDIGLVTNVRAVHMAAFASLDDVAAAKGELFAVLRDDATAVVNLDDTQVRVQATRHVGPQVTFGTSPQADLRLESVDNKFLPGAAMVARHGDRELRLQLRIGGAHSAYNALAALAVVHAVGGDLAAAAARIEQVEPVRGRGRVHRLRSDMLLIDDSYNSSPPALASVLETLRLSEPRGRRVLLLGDMKELGHMETALHREAGRRAAAAGVTLLVGVGPLCRETVDAAKREGLAEVHHFADSARCAAEIGNLVGDGDLILVKGSRAVRMGKVVRALTSSFEEIA